MPRGKRYSDTMRQKLNALFVEGEEKGWSPSEMYRQLQARTPNGQELPSRTGFFYFVRSKRGSNYRRIPPDPWIEPWSPQWPEDSQEIATLMELKKVDMREGIGPCFLTTRVAKWALKIRGCFQGVDVQDTAMAESLLFFSRAYATRERVSEILQEPLYTEDLDAMLMFRPWEGAIAAAQYERAVLDGVIPDFDVGSELFNIAIETPSAAYAYWPVIGSLVREWGRVCDDESILSQERDTLRSGLKGIIENSAKLISLSPEHREAFVTWITPLIEESDDSIKRQFMAQAKDLMGEVNTGNEGDGK